MTRKEINRLAKIAAEAGYQVEPTDFGWTVGAWNKRLEKGLVIAEVYRAERDGYVGGRLICEDVMRDWMKANPV